MTIITCTFDDTTHKVVALDATEESIQEGCLNQQEGSFETYSKWQNSHSSGVVQRIRAFCAEDYKAMIAAAPPYPADTGWIPCSERLPDIATPVLALVGKNTYALARVEYDEGWLWSIGGSDLSDVRNYEADDEYQPTHWMPLPAAPK